MGLTIILTDLCAPCKRLQLHRPQACLTALVEKTGCVCRCNTCRRRHIWGPKGVVTGRGSGKIKGGKGRNEQKEKSRSAANGNLE
jgi:hypothetical protein